MVPFKRTYRQALCSKIVISFMVIMFTGMLLSPGAFAQTSEQRGPESTGTPTSAAMQAASWAVTVPYGAVKVGFAVLGGVVGGLTYMFSAGNTDAAKSVWATTMYGTYVITPEHLKGQKPIRFLGLPDRSSQDLVQIREN